MSQVDVVTGAFSFTGRYIAEELIRRGRRVRTLTRRAAPAGHPLATSVETAPLRFDDALVESLRGVDTLYNTYWVRFERGSVTFASAVENIQHLFTAAAAAGVRRAVHISVAQPSVESPYPYFRGKAAAEAALRATGLSYAIVRPTLVFGPDDILFNNIAWILRRFPAFLLPGDGRYDVQPVSVWDTARIAVDVGAATGDVEVDAAGPERLPFRAVVELVRRAVGSHALVLRCPRRPAHVATSVLGLLTRDVVLTRDEIGALADGLLVSDHPPLGAEELGPWLDRAGPGLGRRYTSELARNFR